MDKNAVRDILIKGAELITEEGKWGQGRWFQDDSEPCRPLALLPVQLGIAPEGWEKGALHSLHRLISPDEARTHRRCAEGALALAATDLGYGYDEYLEAINAASAQAIGPANGPGILWAFNDDLDPKDPFAAAQQVAEVFRVAADKL